MRKNAKNASESTKTTPENAEKCRKMQHFYREICQKMLVDAQKSFISVHDERGFERNCESLGVPADWRAVLSVNMSDFWRIRLQGLRRDIALSLSIAGIHYYH